MGKNNLEDFEPVVVSGAVGLRTTPTGNLVVRVPSSMGSREIVVGDRLIHDDSEVHEPGTDGKLVIPRWLAEREGLEYVEKKS